MPQKINILFWNLYNKPIEKHIKNLVELHNIDVLLLAECAISPANLLQILNEKESLFEFSNSLCEKIKVFTRFKNIYFSPIFEDNRLTIRRLNIPSIQQEVLVASTHFQSKNNWENDDQFSECFNLAQSIQKAEMNVGHQRTILVGDFNMNPFEKGMISASTLHAIGDKNIALKKSRTVSEKKYDFFYNPMWSFLGDLSRGNVAGTYYFSSAKHINYFWNMFDQVLIRPDLIPKFDTDSLDIITTDGEVSFLKNNIINKEISDHLPIKFSLNL